jgi:hypothetical protein
MAITLNTVHAQDQSWQIEVVTEEGAKPEIRIDSEGRPHMAYMIEDFQGGVFHALRDGAEWVIDTVALGYFYAPLDMVIDEEDRVHIAYHDHSTTGGDITYVTGSGDDWPWEVVADNGHDGWDGRIAIGPEGRLHIVSIDPSQFGSNSGIEWATRVDVNDWLVQEIGSGPIPYEFGVAISFDDNGRLHVAYHDGTENLNTTDVGADLLYATMSEGQWHIQTVDSEGDVGKFPALALDSAGLPHITYLDLTGPQTASIRYAYHDGSSWQFEVIDHIDDLEIAFFGARRTTAIALDENDHVYVAYCDKSVLRFARKNEEGWAIEDVAEPRISGSVLAQFVTLELAADGRPHLAYFEIPEALETSTGTIYHALGPEVMDEPTAIAEDGAATPDQFDLGQNYPNPFNPETVIPFTLASSAEVEIAVYDLIGQQVRVLTRGVQTAGHHQVRWDGRDNTGRDTASGAYMIRMRTDGVDQIRKVLLLR